jgi:hypothetical protein
MHRKLRKCMEEGVITEEEEELIDLDAGIIEGGKHARESIGNL